MADTLERVLEVIGRKILIKNPLRDINLSWSVQRRGKFLDRGWRDTTYAETKKLGLIRP